MRTSDSPFLADWFAVSLRWLTLMGFTVSLAIVGALNWITGGIILFSVLWNILVTLLAAQNRRLPNHRIVNVLVDFLTCLALLYQTGGMTGPLSWASVLVIFSGAIYYEWRGSLLVGLGISLVELGRMLAFDPTRISLPALSLFFGLNLLLSLVLGVLGHWLIQGLRSSYRHQVSQRRDAEMKLQRKERDRIQAFYRMIETLNATLNYQVVLDAALDLSVIALGDYESPASEMISAVMLFNNEQLKIEASRRFTGRDLKLLFPAQKGALASSIRTGESQLIQNPFQDPELGMIVAMQSCKSALCLPLCRGLNAFGVMLFAHPDEDFFIHEYRELLEMISHQAVIGIQNARLYQDLALEKECIVEIQDEARKKLARDLHDGPTQSVAVIAMRVSIIRKMMEHDTSGAMQELEKVEDLARRTTQEIRHMLFTLRPLVLESEGLIAALEAMAEKMNETYQQNVLVDVDAEVVNQIEQGKQTVIFYLVEEAVSNSRKHAEASQVWVRLKAISQMRSIALLEIVDNGVGFDVDSVSNSYDRRGSLGMVNLRERAELINGVLNIKSAPGKGTRVQVFIPLTDEASERLQRGFAVQTLGV